MGLITDYNDQIFIKWHTSNGQKVSLARSNEQYRVVKGKIMLKEIPDEFYGITITGMVQLNSGLPNSATEFVVSDWGIGELTFHPSLEGQTITVASYYGRGCVYYPSSKVWVELNESETDVSVTVKDVMNDVKGTVDASKVHENYNAGKAYSIGNKVYKDGSSYICVKNTTAGIPVTNAEYWQIMCAGLHIVTYEQYQELSVTHPDVPYMIVG